MSTLSKEEICKRLSHEVYGYDTDRILNEYSRTGIKKTNQADEAEFLTDSGRYYRTNSSLVAAFYYNETLNEGVIAYRGTERPGLGEYPNWNSYPGSADWKNDFDLMAWKTPTQYQDALYFYSP